MATHPESTFRSPSTLGLLVCILLVAEAVVSMLSAIATAMQVGVLEAAKNGGTLTPGLAELYDSRQRLLAVVELSIGVPTLVLFLAWVYRCNCNARALGNGRLEYSPGWSVGAFFVPVFSLYAPYQVVREIWRASGPPRARTSPLLGTWWAAWLAAGFMQYSRLGTLFGRPELSELTEPPFGEAGRVTEFAAILLDSLLKFSWGLLIRDVVVVAGSVLAVAVVLTITDMQERTASCPLGIKANLDDRRSPDQ